MPIPQKIEKFLKGAGVKYKIIEHRIVYTAIDKSATLKVSPKIIGKTLILKAGPSDFIFALIPADKNLDKQKIKKAINVWHKKAPTSPAASGIRRAKDKAIKNIDFAPEKWMKLNLKGLDLGAVPPFGVIWKIPTFIDGILLKNPKIIINSGKYNCSIKISPASLKKIIPDLVAASFSKKK